MSTNTPIQISPEGLTIAESYLSNSSDIQKTANELNLPAHVVSSQLRKREVKNYIDSIFFSSGFRNRDKLFSLMDTIIMKKLEDLEESGQGSDMDIVDILAKMHAFKMQEIKLQIEADKSSVRNQTNVQINAGGGYNDLMSKLTGGDPE